MFALCAAVAFFLVPSPAFVAALAAALLVVCFGCPFGVQRASYGGCRVRLGLLPAFFALLALSLAFVAALAAALHLFVCFGRSPF